LPDERELVKFCKMAEELGAGVQIRLQHPKLAYLAGRYADLGVLAVMVAARRGRRDGERGHQQLLLSPAGQPELGWGIPIPREAAHRSPEVLAVVERQRLLGFQIETLRAALNARNIVKPGIDWISWGPGDMAFDIERHSNSPFKTIEDVHKYVIDQLKGYDVRLPDS
jgi:2-keto-3-deoxy-L-rhamnonate aldolase RhmA